MADAKSVLDELAGLGAVGPQPKAQPAAEDEVEAVEVEAGAPGPELIDTRGEQMVGLLLQAREGVDAIIMGAERLRLSLDQMLEVWGEGDLEDQDDDLEELMGLQRAEDLDPPAEEAPLAPVAPPPVPEPAPVTPEDPAYVRAREEALKKIRGEDIPPEQLAAEDDGVPFVGAEHARPVGQEPQEVSLGTVGTMKVNLPPSEG